MIAELCFSERREGMPRATRDLNYTYVNHMLRDNARKDWLLKRDITTALSSMNNVNNLDFVISNLGVLVENGKLAEALLWAWSATRTNNSGHKLADLRYLFITAGREALLKHSDKLPHGGPFELYRGVNGIGANRRVKGLSWTSDFEEAKFFAERYKDQLPGKPAVFKIVAPIEWVYGYTQDREESEYILLLPPDAKPKCIWKAE
ncbi:MAG: hypothetical protein GX556_16020 [Fibrobacter sp.]|nr:hypothetical protein [Fibrobacter sp.]